jgi:hypothetical protein
VTTLAREPPEQLDAVMRPSDIVDILGRLNFRGDGVVIEIDRPIRDYLLDCVRARIGRRSR